MSQPVVLITGCSSGIGRSLAIELAQRGCTVYASARRPETIAGLKQDNLHTLALDLDNRRAVKGMIARRSGCIVNVGSISGIMATPFAGAYCGTKAAFNVMSDALRMELAPFNVDVVIVAPGAVKSRFGDNAEHGVEITPDSVYVPIQDAIIKRAQMSQVGATPSEQVAREIADGILASPRPTWIATGAGAVKYPLMKRLLPTRKLDAKMVTLFGLDRLRN
jgi:short-subunit dehydrogenase